MTPSNNLNLVSLCEEDQGDRGEYLKSPTPEHWKKVTDRDLLRRARVVEIMQQNEMHTADDFFHAGLIMLHGFTTEESILGHVFAMAASSKGHHAAAWLSAMTLDNMMLSLEQGQVFDSQPLIKSDNISMYKEVEKTVFISDSIKSIFDPPPD